MPVVSAGQGPALLAEDLDAIDEFGGEIGVQRFIPVVAELCSAEVES
jgi:hypothetical protein